MQLIKPEGHHLFSFVFFFQIEDREAIVTETTPEREAVPEVVKIRTIVKSQPLTSTSTANPKASFTPTMSHHTSRRRHDSDNEAPPE